MPAAHPQSILAKLARDHPLKKDLQQHLKGAELAEAWHIAQVQKGRYERKNTWRAGNYIYTGRNGWVYDKYFTPQPASEYRLRFLNPAYHAQAQIWEWASHYQTHFITRIARRIKAVWPYRWEDKKYHLSVHHSHKNEIMVDGRRGADSYTTYFVTLSFNVLTHEAVEIGGLITIRAKVDAALQSYPCHWLERFPHGPGLKVVPGRIERGDYHEPSEDAFPQKTAKGRSSARLRWIENRLDDIQAATQRTKDLPPPTSPWVTRSDSLAAGNCVHGTDSFMMNELPDALIKFTGCSSVGKLTGSAVHIDLLRSILVTTKNRFLKRVIDHVRARQKQAA